MIPVPSDVGTEKPDCNSVRLFAPPDRHTAARLIRTDFLYTREDRCESGRKKGRTFDRPDMIEREYNRSSTFSRAKLDVLVAEYNWTTPQDGRVVS